MEPLNPSNLTLPKEQTYFIILAVFSALVWLVCIFSIVPIVGLIIAGFVGWLAHGLLIARIKSEAVKLDANQMPELAAAFAEICAKLNLKSVPELYLMQSGGILNAFATRHCARNFVVIYSDILEAYGPQSGEIKFLLGHEIGHIRSNHIFKNMLLVPGLFLPLIGAAYNRACESSCDRHGAFASGDAAASVTAMMILSGGKQAGRELMADAFSNQHHVARGFFISLHELFSAYPTLSKRVSDLLDIQYERSTPRPGRNPFAYLIGLFCPGVRYGVFGVAITVYMVAIMASLMVPAVAGARNKARAIQAEQYRTQSAESDSADLPSARPR